MAPGSTLKEFAAAGRMNHRNDVREDLAKMRLKREKAQKEAAAPKGDWDAKRLMNEMKRMKVLEERRPAPLKMQARLEKRAAEEEKEVKRLKYRMVPPPLTEVLKNVRAEAAMHSKERKNSFLSQQEDTPGDTMISRIHDEVLAKHPEMRPKAKHHHEESQPAPAKVAAPAVEEAKKPLLTKKKRVPSAPAKNKNSTTPVTAAKPLVGSVVKTWAGNHTVHRGLRGLNRGAIGEQMTSIPVMMPGDTSCHQRVRARAVGMKVEIARSFAEYEVAMERRKRRRRRTPSWWLGSRSPGRSRGAERCRP